MTTDKYVSVNPDIPLLPDTSQHGDFVARRMLGEMARRRRVAWWDYVLTGRSKLHELRWMERRNAYRACRNMYLYAHLSQYGGK